MLARAVAALGAAALALPLAADSGVDERLRKLAASVGQGRPLMRIGLTPAHAIEISSSRPFRVLDPATGAEVWRPTFDEPLRVVAEGGPRGEVARVYRVQVGAFGSPEAAERERARLEQELKVPAVVHPDPDRGNWRVRVGRADDRLELQPLLERLRALGLEDHWIAEEPAERLDAVSLRLVDDSYRSHLTDSRRLVAVPSGSAHIKVEGVDYRGLIELRVTEFGEVRPINWIQLEAYLLGVVPEELGPEVWPQLEALKAQAVAARTYAWKNRGQFAEEGYDLCATPRCQVYGGASAEHPVSDRAVAETRGQILLWQGEPIVAYYTATCGGHTEDGSAVFPEETSPYLKGVACRAEDAALAALRGTLGGRKLRPLFDETGADVTRDWALLVSGGVIPAGHVEPKQALRPIDRETLREWTRRLARLAGLPEPTGPPGPVGTLGQAAASLALDLGWDERAQVLLSGQDLPALLRDREADELPEPQRRALAYLALSEAIGPFPDGRFHVERKPSEARLARALARVGETYRAFGLRSGVISGVGRESIRVVRGKGELRVNLDAQPLLFGWTAGQPVPVERLEIWPGDRVRFRTGAAGAVDFLEMRPPVKGASDDRVAAVYSWEERRTLRELEASIDRRLSIGRLQDLEVLRRGVSKRVVELRVVGSKGTAVVRGFDVRRLLDLRESLIVIEKQRDAAGGIEAVVFAGKGWGHGIGLCQVGAYGMALRGAGYDEILRHYYQGVELGRVPAAAR